MARRNRTAETVNGTAETTAATDQHTKITMTEFQNRPDRADWYTIKNAAKYLGADPDDGRATQAIRNAIRNRPEFRRTADGTDRALLVEIEGYDIPALTYAHRDALDVYRDRVDTGKGTGRERGGAKRYIIRLTAEQYAQYAAGDLVLNFERFPLETASTPKSRAKANAETSQPAELVGDSAA